AERRSLPPRAGRSRHRAALAPRRPALPADGRGLARQLRRQRAGDRSRPGRCLRRRGGDPLAHPLARVLHGLRRDVRLPRRPGVDRVALLLQEEVLMLTHFGTALAALVVLDGLWLGVVMKGFY